MTLRDSYDDSGRLRDGPLRYKVDEVEIHDPWPATLDEISAVLGLGQHRQHLLWHLVGFVEWFNRALIDDPLREIWLRGRFVSTLAPEVDELDLVVHYAGAKLNAGDRWVLMILAASATDLHPGRIYVTALRHDGDGYERERDVEARRSQVAALDPVTKEQLRAGWLVIQQGR